MRTTLQFPAEKENILVQTETLQRAINRTLAVHYTNPIVVWSGPAGVGKTRTAAYLQERLARECDGGMPNAFRARHFEIASISGSGAEKRLVRSLYHATLGVLPEGQYRTTPVEDLAGELVEGLQLRRMQMILIDEAGQLSVQALRAICLVRNVAEQMSWPLTFVLIGMDTLPDKIKSCPQVYRRVHEWCYFQDLTENETSFFLRQVHPHFAAQTDDAGYRAQVTFVHSTYSGRPGRIIPFLHKLDAFVRDNPDIHVDLTVLKAVEWVTSTDEQRCVDDSNNHYRGQPSLDEKARQGVEKVARKSRVAG
jgi:hypothetical protein